MFHWKVSLERPKQRKMAMRIELGMWQVATVQHHYKNVYKMLAENPEGKRPVWRPRSRWEGNIKMDLQKIGWWRGQDSSGSRQGRVVDSCEHGNETSGSTWSTAFQDQLSEYQLLKDSDLFSSLTNLTKKAPETFFFTEPRKTFAAPNPVTPLSNYSLISPLL
jgi:hypothetical protein